MKLPIEPFLGEIRRRVREEGRLLLTAAPGAGKTTCVPGALAAEFPEGRIFLVEPRRVAAAAAAWRISEILGEEPGGTAGYAVRGEHCGTSRTRIMAVTPGVLLRKLQQDPALEEAVAVIFDEFHERSAECDLLFTLLLDSAKALRSDLKIVLMSATLETARARELLGAGEPLVVPGREFPVEVRWSDAVCPRERIPETMAGAILRALPETEGNMLAFFPGTGEIGRCAELLEGRTPANVPVQELHGALPLGEQSQVLKAAPPGTRKIVLCTNIAESSLTVADVRCVIDCGYERRPCYDPGSGLTFLETVPVSQASATQRSGRAGRVAPGIALRLWNRESHGGRAPFRRPEICSCELASLALELALWGAEPGQLEWLDPPPEGAWHEAVALLRSLGALDRDGRPTPKGKRLASFPVHPRLAAMLLRGEELNAPGVAAGLAALLENRTDTSFPDTADVETQLLHLRKHLRSYRGHRVILDQLKSMLHAEPFSGDMGLCGELLLAAFPERLAGLRRKNGLSYTLRNGRGATLAEGDILRGSEFLAVAELGGRGSGDAPILRAAPLTREEVMPLIADEIEEKRLCSFDESASRVQVRQLSCVGSIVLAERPVPAEPGELPKALLEYAANKGIRLISPGDKTGNALWERLRFAHRAEPELFPEWNGKKLAAEAWVLLPELKTLSQLSGIGWAPLLKTLAGREVMERLDRAYPEKYRTPAGAEHPIDYSGETPLLRVKLQEMLGVKVHPVTGTRKLPLRIELLSPALRPIQTTSDLPGFWHGTYALVRKEMKARYPKHFWPEDPAEALPSLRSVKKK